MTRSRNIMGPRIPFGPEEDAIIRDLFPINKTRDVARLIDRTESSVYQYAARHGIKKSADYLATKAFRLNGSEQASIPHRFKPGQAPANKGLRRPGYAPGRMATTQFRKGVMAGAAQHNYVPVGTEKVRDGLLCRKVTDDPNIYPAARWQPVSRIVWEQHNGPIPPGHAVAFKPGRATTDVARITIDALDLLSRADLMRRNTRHNYPPELNQLYALKAALNRKINRRMKESA